MSSQEAKLYGASALCRYPHCLYFLDLLQSKDFRSSMANGNAKVRSATTHSINQENPHKTESI